MPRHEEPEHVKLWRNPAPEICHTCEHYDEEGICQLHQQEPPEDFAKQEGACPDWLIDLPF